MAWPEVPDFRLRARWGYWETVITGTASPSPSARGVKNQISILVTIVAYNTTEICHLDTTASVTWMTCRRQ